MAAMFDAAAFVLPAPARAGPIAGQAAENGILMNDLGDALPVYSSPGGWIPGRVVMVQDGAVELQAILDEMLEPLVVISWHAGWVDVCRDAVQPFARLAARFPDIAFLQVDIDANPRFVTYNDSAAWDMVLTKPEARRQDAKPVLRDYQRFPAFTTHLPPTLRPWTQLLTGPEALDQLLAASEAATSGVAPVLPEGKILVLPPDTDTVETPATAATATSRGDVDNTATSQASAATASDVPLSAVPQAAQAPLQVVDKKASAAVSAALTGGPADLKGVLTSARATGNAVVLLWYSSGTTSAGPSQAASASTGGTNGGAASSSALAELQSEAERLAAELPDVVVYLADVNASKANTVLASALKVGDGPVCHIYRKMKLVGRVAAAGKLAAALIPKAEPTPAAAAPDTRVSFSDQSPAGPSGSRTTAVAGEEESGAETVGVEATEGSVWDPPPREELPFGKVNDTRTFTQGVGQYYPRMPCLRCGCPWWLGEDWDARCARCGWDCEEEGYDDDSKPLAALKSTWQRFTAAVRRGKTPEWEGEYLANRCSTCR